MNKIFPEIKKDELEGILNKMESLFYMRILEHADVLPEGEIDFLISLPWDGLEDGLGHQSYFHIVFKEEENSLIEIKTEALFKKGTKPEHGNMNEYLQRIAHENYLREFIDDLRMQYKKTREHI